MSWSASYTNIDGVRDDFDPSKVQPPNLDDHVREAFDTAVKAALDMINSRHYGVDCKWNVTLSGHANVGHVPVSGWVNDCVTVAVSQV